MAAEKKQLLHLLFQDSNTDDLESDLGLDEYINKLGGYKIEELLREPTRLQAENNGIFEQTQELAISNYRTFIDTAECSRQLSKQFSSIESKLDELLSTHIRDFEANCKKFADETSGINNLRKLNSLTLTRNAQLLEILELPQLMNSFINDGLYEDALELALYVRKSYNKHPDIPVFKSIVHDVEKSWLLMLHQLLFQLKSDLPLPKCIQIVGHIRRMEVFTEAELRLKFLQTRSVWLHSCLGSIPKDDVNYHITKVIEVTRVNLFSIVTQYRAIFNDDEHSPLSTLDSQQVNQNVIFFNWIQNCVNNFLTLLKEDLSRGVSSIDSILGQCMYFGASFSKVGCDFRSSLVPIFTNAIFKKFENSVAAALKNFNKNIEKFTLINKNHPGVPWKNKSEDPLQPPDSLLEFYPLAEYLNNILTAFNELKLCPPLAVVDDVVKCLEKSLVAISESIHTLYGQEQQAFTASSKDAFTRLCMIFADDLVPYTQKCIHVIFPLHVLSSYLGINVQVIQNNGISFLSRDKITEPIKNLLPIKVEPSLCAEPKHSSVENKDRKREVVADIGSIGSGDNEINSTADSAIIDVNKEDTLL